MQTNHNAVVTSGDLAPVPEGDFIFDEGDSDCALAMLKMRWENNLDDLWKCREPGCWLLVQGGDRCYSHRNEPTPFPDEDWDAWLDTAEGSAWAQRNEFLASVLEYHSSDSLAEFEQDSDFIMKCDNCGQWYAEDSYGCPECHAELIEKRGMCPVGNNPDVNCIHEDCMHFWYEGCDAGCNIDAPPWRSE
jgi:hypothetical protein